MTSLPCAQQAIEKRFCRNGRALATLAVVANVDDKLVNLALHVLLLDVGQDDPERLVPKGHVAKNCLQQRLIDLLLRVNVHLFKCHGSCAKHDSFELGRLEPAVRPLHHLFPDEKALGRAHGSSLVAKQLALPSGASRASLLVL